MLSKDHLHIPEFIKKLYVFTFFSEGVISLTSYPFSARVIERKKNLIFFYMSCRYLNIVKKTEDTFTRNRKFPNCYNIKIIRVCIVQNMAEINVIFVELCMIVDTFFASIKIKEKLM